MSWKNDNPRAERCLQHARGFARGGNATWAQLWLNQANSFAGVSEQQVQALNRMIVQARARKAAAFTFPWRAR
jgi:hypothetical protein